MGRREAEDLSRGLLMQALHCAIRKVQWRNNQHTHDVRHFSKIFILFFVTITLEVKYFTILVFILSIQLCIWSLNILSTNNLIDKIREYMNIKSLELGQCTAFTYTTLSLTRMWYWWRLLSSQSASFSSQRWWTWRTQTMCPSNHNVILCKIM